MNMDQNGDQPKEETQNDTEPQENSPKADKKSSKFEKKPQKENKQRLNLGEEKPLGTKTLVFQNKRFYLDVKQSIQGKLIKIAEMRPGNRKSRIVFNISCGAELRDKLSSFSEFYSKLPPHDPAQVAANHQQGPTLGGSGNNKRDQQNDKRFIETSLRADTITREDRKYYLDLKENLRGRFLRITMMTQVTRALIVVPGNGMIAMRDALEELIAEFATPNELEAAADKAVQELMESHIIRSERRIFYFDVGSNPRGMFLRISEVNPRFRASITIPDVSWSQFRDNMADYVDKLNTVKQEVNKNAKSEVSVVNGAKTKDVSKEGENKEVSPTKVSPRAATKLPKNKEVVQVEK